MMCTITHLGCACVIDQLNILRLWNWYLLVVTLAEATADPGT